MMMIDQPLPCLPKLIEQPTWGGRFILELKGLDQNPLWDGKKIGQSYELYGGTEVLINQRRASLKSLLADYGEEILGKRLYERIGPKMPLLLKLTQAKGNSYQIHLKPGHNHPRWRPKAESWYYLAPGCLTLGVKKGTDWSEYAKTVREIAAKMTALSREVRANNLNLEEAKSKAAEIIQDNNPARFVNQITAREGEVWDLSACGLHHSWEENPHLAPRGNLVYEIQEDVPDEISSIRAFDKGKIKSDGSLRELHPDDYFRFIDRSPEANDPNAARRQPKLIEKFSGGQAWRLITSPRYRLELITLSGAVSGRSTDASGTFHHLFAKTGAVTIHYGRGQNCRLKQGTSALIPAAVGAYELSGKGKAEVIKSYVQIRQSQPR